MDENRYTEIPHTVEAVRFEIGKFPLEGDLILPEGAGEKPVLVYVWGSGPAGRHKGERLLEGAAQDLWESGRTRAASRVFW